MIINESEKLELEQKINFYRSCIKISLSKEFNLSNMYIISGIEVSASEVLLVTNSIIEIYGSVREKKKYRTKFGFMINQDIDENVAVERLKYIYEFRQQYGYDEEKCKKFAKYMGIRLSEIMNLSREYAVKHLCLRLDEYDWLYYKNVAVRDGRIKSELPYQILFDLLLMMDDNEDVIFLIEYSKQKLHSLFASVNKYIEVHCSEEQNKEQIINKLISKLNLYKKYKENLYKQELMEHSLEHLRQAEAIVLDYINCDKNFTTITDYCRYKGILYNSFINNTVIVRKYNSELYELYREMVMLNRINGSADANYVANLVCYYIENGVATEQGIREFDLIDYYAMTGLKIEEVLKISESMLSKTDMRKLSKMRGLNDKAKEFLSPSIRAIDIDIEFNCQKDKDGFPIPGTGRKITQEEVDTIIEIFELYNIPFNLFKVATDRIKNGVDLHDVAPVEINTNNKVKKLVKVEEE